MFTQKKKNYRTFLYTAVVITLCLLIVALLWPQEKSPQNSAGPLLKRTEVREPVNQQDSRLHSADTRNEDADYGENQDQESEDEDSEDEDEIENYVNNEKDNIFSKPHAYYLVKKADDCIKVFFVDRTGRETELETTKILYEVLGPEDQKLFDEGYRVQSQEELAELLQDFES